MASNEQNRPGAVLSPKEDIALRIDEIKRRDAEARRRKLVRVIGSVFLSLVSISLIFGVYWWMTKRPSVPSAIRQTESSIGKVEESVFEYGKLKETEVKLTDGNRFPIRIFDFDVYYYLQGQDHVVDETKFVNVLNIHKENLTQGWIVIFAGASYEDDQYENLGLCRRRVSAVAELMLQKAQINSLGYWGIPAGEYRLVEKATQGQCVEDEKNIELEEEVQAKKLKDEELRKQRRLIVTVVTPPPQLAASSESKLPEVIKVLVDQGILPANYDCGRTKPARLNP